MGERRPNLHAGDGGLDQKRELTHLDPGSEVVIVPGEGGYKGAQTPALEQDTTLDAPVRTSQRVEFRTSNEQADPEFTHGKIIFDYFEENKRLQEQLKRVHEANAALQAKVTNLIEENHELWDENTRLNDALKEFQELKEKEERRKELQRQRAAKWREEHPEMHRARSAEAMRKIRAEAKQQADSAQ